MADMTLVIADKNYSLWPVAPWLCLRTAGFDFDEVLIRFTDPQRRDKMLAYGPTGRVPVLHHKGQIIWDSLAICEYVAELSPKTKLWPDELNARAIARSFAAEMHASGGSYPGAVRHIIYALDTNVRRQTEPVRPEPPVQEAIDHLIESWDRLRQTYGHGGPFLFGHFTIADAMSAHLVNRLATYNVAVPPAISDYINAVRAFPPMAQWITEAAAEDWILPSAEIEITSPTAP